MKRFFSTLWAIISAPFQQLASQDIKALVICIFLSAIFWLSITLNKTYTTTHVLYIQLQEQLYPLQLEIKGSGWTLLRLLLRSSHDTLLFSTPTQVDVIPTTQWLPTIKKLFPDNVDIRILTPDSVMVDNRAPLATKKVILLAPVEQIKATLCDSCYLLSTPTPTPSQLNIEGAPEQIRLFPDTLMLPFDNRPISKPIYITYRSAQLLSQKNVKVTPTVIHLHLPVDYLQQATFNVPVAYKNFPEKGHWHAQPTLVKIRVQGPPDAIQALSRSTDALQAWVSFEESSFGDSLRVQTAVSIKEIKIREITPSYLKLLHP